MLSVEENQMLTQVGPGTPMGALLRHYWQPVALASDLPEGTPPMSVTLMGEELVLFRDEEGSVGLLDTHCAHRGADLSYGRIEDGGLRCTYHGWLYDIHGRCLETPGEPASSRLPEKVHHTAYPCLERGGFIFAYMGAGNPPQLPAYEFLNAPEDRRYLDRVFHDCNFQQGNEGNMDPVHLSFLHRLVDPSDPHQALNTKYLTPELETEQTEFGIRTYTVRKLEDGRNYVRVTNFVMPNFSCVTGDAEGYTVLWHVPIDDTHHWRYRMRFNRTVPVGTIWRGGQEDPELTEDRHLVRNKANRYLQDRESMKSWSFLGMGRAFIVHDSWATQSPGAIQDRTKEMLGYTDKAVTAARRLLFQAMRDVQEGADPLHVVRDPDTNPVPDIYVRNDVILPGTIDWHRYWENETAMQEAIVTGRGRQI